MTADSDKSIILRSILVAVDTSAHSRAALKAAAALANIMKADIRGLFVQEEHWSRLSRLPTANVINELTGRAQKLEEESLNRQVNELKSRLRKELQYISNKYEVAHSWETKEGKVADQILEAAQKADLITIGRRGRSSLSSKKLGSTAQTLIQKSEKPILVLKKGLQLGKSIAALYDSSAESRKGLQLALSLAEKNDRRLSILVTNNRQESAGERNKRVEKMVDNTSIPVSVTMLNQPSIGSFIHAINRQRSGLLVIPKHHAFLQNDSLETTLDYLNCPVLMMS